MKNPQRELVTTEYARQKLRDIGERVPMVLGVLQKQAREGGKTTGQYWADDMAGLDREYFDAIIEPYVKMTMKVPQDAGGLGSDIIEQTRLLMARAVERANTERITTYEKSNVEWNRTLQTDPAVNRGTICRVGRWIMDRDKAREPIPKEQQEELFAWASGKLARPDWLSKEDTKYILDDVAPKVEKTIV